MPQELSATKQLLGSKTKKNQGQHKLNQEEANKKAYSAQNFFEWLQTKPGIWNYMIQRDRNIVAHLERIPCSSIIIYVCMLLLSVCIVYVLVPPGRMYYMRNGPLVALSSEYTLLGMNGSMVRIPQFQEIKTQEAAWDWLAYVVPHTLLNATSEFRSHNYLTGWLRLRMQQVKEADSSVCMPSDVSPSDISCVHYNYNPETAGKEDLELLKVYWNGWNLTNTTNSSNAASVSAGGGRRLASDSADDDFWNSFGDYSDSARELYAPWTDQYKFSYGWNFTGLSEQPVVAGLDGRSSTIKPWQYIEDEDNAEKHDVESLVGIVQRYDPSGYNLDYELQYNDYDALYHAYQADLVAVRERGWFTDRTRAIFVHFTIYNANFDLWANCDFILEMNAASVVQPFLHVNVFSASVNDIQHNKWLFWMDTVRLIFALYAGTIQVCYEIRKCKENEESKWFSYLLTPIGICDVGICVFAIIIWIIRDLLLGLGGSSVKFLEEIIQNGEFQSSSARAWIYRFGMQMEGPLFGFLILRTLSFLRINRSIFIVWHTMWECGKRHLPYLAIFIPIVFGFTLWAHTIYLTLEPNYTDLPSSFISVLMMALGDVEKDRMFIPHRPNTYLFAIVFYIAMVIFLINTWISVIVWTYEKVRVEAGYCPNDYKWKEKHYANWMLAGPCARFYFNTLRPRIDKPKKYAHDDEDD